MKNYYQILDKILYYINDKNSTNHSVGLIMIQKEFLLTDNEIKVLREKLERDKLIVKTDENNYSLTFEGLLFIQDGAYLEKRRVEFITKNFQYITTILLTIGTFGVLIIEFLKYHYECKCP
jgi:hypothetical protein